MAALASRLSEKPAATARASGVPGCAVYLAFRAMNWTLVPTLRKMTICGPPKRRDTLLLIEPEKKPFSPRPWSRWVEKK